MDQWAILIVGTLAVAAAWDYGRRLTQKNLRDALSARIDELSQRWSDLSQLHTDACLDTKTLRKSIDDRFHDVNFDIKHMETVTSALVTRDFDGLTRRTEELETKLRGLTNKTEAAAAVNRPRGFPRIG